MGRSLTAILFAIMMIASSLAIVLTSNAGPGDDYHVYSNFNPTDISDVTGVGGYVEDYGVPETWGDEIQFIYFLSGAMGYKVKVWVTNEGSPGDPTPYIDIRQHPDHPSHPGPIEPRHFEIVSSADLSAYVAGSGLHTEEFYIDSSGVYVGAYPNGIHKWDHSWSYIGKIANSPTSRTESIAYNSGGNVWYAGGRDRKIYQLSDTDDDGSFMDESWAHIFTYPSYGGSHHDGMEYIGIRGPYGNGFKIDGKRILFVGGGTGVAMLAPAAEEAGINNISSTIIIGVKNSSELFFEDRFKKCGAEIHISTDDGSKGYKGFATDLADELLSKEKFTSVLACGPEIMMKNLLDLCKNIPFQASLERYMKCGVGICSQCCIGEGLRVCVEGSIFDGKTLKNIEDFGVYKRDATGRKTRF